MLGDTQKLLQLPKNKRHEFVRMIRRFIAALQCLHGCTSPAGQSVTLVLTGWLYPPPYNTPQAASMLQLAEQDEPGFLRQTTAGASFLEVEASSDAAHQEKHHEKMHDLMTQQY